MTRRIRRVLCAAAPVLVDGHFVQIPHRIAVLPWSMPEAAMTVMVRLTVPLAAGRGDEVEGVISPGPFRAVCEPSAGPDDFVPIRPVTDVVLVGNLPPYPRPSGAATVLAAHLEVGYARSTFQVERDAIQSRPFAAHVTGDGGAPIDIGPKPTRDAAAEDFAHPVAFDYEDYQSAERNMRTTYPDPGDPIEVRNLIPGPEEIARGSIPARAPRLLVDPSEAASSTYEVPLDLDTVTIDLDRAAADVTYRGVLRGTFQVRNEIDRLIVTFATAEEWGRGESERWSNPLRRLCRGTFRHAEERSDVLAGMTPPELTDDELAMARYETWDGPGAPEPTLDIESFASIQADLAEQWEPRADTLGKHGLDDYAWNVEERAWSERLADSQEPDRDATFARYEQARLAARARHEKPEDRTMPIARFAGIRARVEGRDPMGALAAAGLGLGKWMRIEEAMQDRAVAAPEFEAELERELDAARAREQERDPIDVDHDPEPEPSDPVVTMPEAKPSNGCSTELPAAGTTMTMYVVGIGARSPFGLDARQTSLALRASMYSPRPSPWRSRRAEQTLGSHRSAAIDDAIEGEERLVALALPALREALAGVDAESVALILALAEPRVAKAQHADTLARRLGEEAGLRVERSRSLALRSGHAGLAMALGRASSELSSGARLVVVGCVDSYHEEAQMQWLDEEHRVLGPHAHNGLVPSEGAAFMALTREPPAQGAWCSIDHVEGAFEPEPQDLTTSTYAETATGLLHRAARAAGGPFPWVLTDVSNERHRVKEWLALQIRCREALSPDDTTVTRLVETGGDTGAAGGGLSLVYACAAWRWGFAPADRALLSMQSEGRERGVVVASAPKAALLAGVSS